MRCGPVTWPALVLAAASAVAFAQGRACERRLTVRPRDGVLLYAGDGEDETRPSNGATQRLGRLGGELTASYSYTNFNRDRLAVDFSLPAADFARYEAGFGYYKRDIQAFNDWDQRARDAAYRAAVAAHRGQAQLDAAVAAVDRERDAKIKEYMTSRGFRLLPGHVVTVDIPGVVRRNGPLLNKVAGALQSVADRRDYDSESIIGAALSLVQTAVIYKVPPDVEPDGRHTGGILQPAATLLKGWGDCDTKTALLASILANWPQMRMVGVSVPGHYLMGVLRIPEKGDAYVEYQGLQYVLVEPAGPAWLPLGQVASTTQPLLEASEGFRIDPLF